MKDFEEGIHLYIEGDFHAATDAFERVLGYYPEDRAAKRFIEKKSKRLLLIDVTTDWDGVDAITNK